MAGVVGAAGAAVTVITAQEREHGSEQGLVATLHQHVEDPPALENLQTLETVTVNAVSTELFNVCSELLNDSIVVVL